MQAKRQFSIPFKGLNFGKHAYNFDIDARFFEVYPSSPIKNGHLVADVNLDRKTDHLLLLIGVSGTIETTCDRCTAVINLPIEGSYEYIVKFGEVENEWDEVVYIHPEDHHINVSDLIYEQIILSVPMIKVYDCTLDMPKPCNQNVLSILDNDVEDQNVESPLSEALKNLKITKTK